MLVCFAHVRDMCITFVFGTDTHTFVKVFQFAGETSYHYGGRPRQGLRDLFEMRPHFNDVLLYMLKLCTSPTHVIIKIGYCYGGRQELKGGRAVMSSCRKWTPLMYKTILQWMHLWHNSFILCIIVFIMDNIYGMFMLWKCIMMIIIIISGYCTWFETCE